MSPLITKSHQNMDSLTLTGWLSWLEHHPVTERLWVRFPVRAHIPRLLFYPPTGCVHSLVGVHTGGNQSMFLSLPSCLPSSVYKTSEKNKCRQVRIKKIREKRIWTHWVTVGGPPYTVKIAAAPTPGSSRQRGFRCWTSTGKAL